MLALAVYQEGQYYLFNQQPAEARKRFDEALQLYFEQHQSIYTANIYNDIGFSESDLHLRDQSAFWYGKAKQPSGRCYYS